MDLIFLIIGITLVIFALIDLIWTSLWVDGGAGPVSNRVTNMIWEKFYKLDRGNHRLLKFAGPFILVSTLLLWILMLWSGWALIFASDSESLVNTISDRPVLWHDIVYYAAYVMFTLGSGEFAPVTWV